MINFILSIIGVIVVLGLMFLLSSDKSKVDYKLIIKCLVIQIIISLLVVKFPLGRWCITAISSVVTTVLDCGKAGLSFVFGSLADASMPTGSIFAISVLASIIFVSALVAGLYYVGAINWVVSVVGKAIGKLLGTTQVETFVAVANMFLGQTESPLLVSKYLKHMTSSEIAVVLVSGMGSMSATILGGYSAMGIPMEYLLTACALVPIGSLMVSKIIYPETEQTKSDMDVKIDSKGDNANLIGAISEGAVNGMQVALAIGASLIAIIGLVEVVDVILRLINPNLSLSVIFGYIFSIFGYLFGFRGADARFAGQLLGSKLVLNEFISYGDLGAATPMYLEGVKNVMTARTPLIMAVMCAGFANFSSIGICISGIGALCSEKKGTLAKLALKCMFGGFCVSLLSAYIISIITAF